MVIVEKYEDRVMELKVVFCRKVRNTLSVAHVFGQRYNMQKEFNLELMYTTFEEINRFFCDAPLVVILMLQMLEIVIHGNAQVAFWQVDVDRP